MDRSGAVAVRTVIPAATEPSDCETADAQFWSSEERQAFCRFVDRRAEQAVDERGLAAVPELRDRALVYLLAYSGARSAEVLRDPNGDFEAAQRVMRHADPSTTSAMYSHIEAGELAEEASAAFEHVDET